MSVRIVTLIDNVHMGLGHPGLTEIAKRHARVNPETLAAGEILMFLNRAKDKLKILGAQGIVIGYLRMPEGRKIALEAIQYIPSVFGSTGQINYDAALKKALETRLRRERQLGPLEVFRAKERAGLTARKQTTTKTGVENHG